MESAVIENITHSSKQLAKESCLCADFSLKTYMHVLHPSDEEIKEELQEIRDILDLLGDSILQYQTNGQCCNDTTGSFLNPAHNCSHISKNHLSATSGQNFSNQDTSGHVGLKDGMGISEVTQTSKK
jgi:hypothetical protein